jgi:flavin reductase (DIM6/NTAB) family NADH-FMN oxidoreductase RutF
MAKKRIDPGPFVVPMPLVLVGAEVEGKPNFMPAAFLGIANYGPPILACGLNPEHRTCRGIEEHGEFSISLPPPELVEPTDWCGIWSGDKKDKSGVFKTFTGELPKAPMVEECRFAAECKLVQTVKFDIDTVYFGEVKAVHVDEDALKDDQPDWQKIDPMIFTFPDKGYWRLGDFVARAWRVGKDYGKS